jgi:UPF0271 protein
MMLINCDIGERGVAHPVDDQLMQYIDIANIACGGHAGNQHSVDYYYALAIKNKIKSSVHLSYPDPKNFGRVNMNISDKQLLNALDQQYDLLTEVTRLKFHGALYNEANHNKKLAQLLMHWAITAGITEILTPQYSQLVNYAQEMRIIYEVFLDRRYLYENHSLLLQNRAKANAMIIETDQVMKQYHHFNQGQLIIADQCYPIQADTACIHSDSPNALTLIRAIKGV